MSERVMQAVVDKFGESVLGTSAQCGDETVILDRAALRDVATFLRDDPEMAFNMPVDCTCVDYLDYPGHTGPRFHVVYHLYSLSKGHRIRLKVPVDLDDMTVPSLSLVWKGMNWPEREAWDMYGVRFQDHPNLKRMLLYEEFEGHPLRKDYPLRGYQPLVPIAELDPDNEDPKMRDVDLNPEPPHE